MEEPPAPFADAPPPYEWGDEEYDLSDCLLSTWTEGEAILAETVTEDGTVPPEVETVSGYDRLFSDEELDAMENGEPGQEASILSGTVVVPEPEEYNKELEDRLYPLDEVELHKRVAKNAEAQAEPSSEDLARLLGISLEVVERTRQASPYLHGSPEYWQNWFEDMLDKSEEAKRANRDFRSPVVSVVYGPSVEAPARPEKASSVESGSYGESVPSNRDEEFASEAWVAVESVMSANVERPPDDPSREVAVVEAVPVLSEGRGVDPKTARAVARQAVFRFLQEARSNGNAMATSVRLPPLGQALVTTRVVGSIVDKSTVLVEGSLGLPPTLCVARSLCTVEDGQVIVEVCNASTDEYWIRKGTAIACTSVIPESAFESATVEQKGTAPADDNEPGVERAASVSEAGKLDVGEK
ncbi:hypothetical protein PF001_g23360 [Phytophthora fragariae]|uniref:Uncharacterized protein n=1 Tax=Phytophthora fragariae TaxID=53985 RepID=A0A6A4BYE2_9STRA|nr:hypothetical protein PF001_g23360 [Phytophthora fragariae]